MPNSPSQMIPDTLDWRQICGSGRLRKDSSSVETVTHLLCKGMRSRTVLLKNGSLEPLHEWQHMWLQDVIVP
ncbi:hypothetical protein TNCV_2905391 [Trichonephila clavipes]|nr:hypothetical protein TNCV_2905391 [Trichonephila clavipes]